MADRAAVIDGLRVPLLKTFDESGNGVRNGRSKIGFVDRHCDAFSMPNDGNVEVEYLPAVGM